MKIRYISSGRTLLEVERSEVPREGEEMQFAAIVHVVRTVRWLEDGEPSPCVDVIVEAL